MMGLQVIWNIFSFLKVVNLSINMNMCKYLFLLFFNG